MLKWMETMEDNEIIINEDNILFRTQGIDYSIPSDLFPLSSTQYIILNANNTEKLKNKRMAEIFNKQEYLIGRCYTNAETLYKLLLQKLVSKSHLKYMVGWLFIGPGIPIHHAMLLYKNKYVLDLSPILSGKYQKGYYSDVRRMYPNCNTQEVYMKWYTKFQKEPNIIKGTFGKMKEDCFFIGCESTKENAIQLWNTLIDKYPDHPAYTNIDEDGTTPIQRQLLQNNLDKK